MLDRGQRTANKLRVDLIRWSPLMGEPPGVPAAYVGSHIPGSIALDSVSVLPPDTKLVTGAPRGAVGTPGANLGPRNTDNDIWASDLHLTPNGRFLYAAERTSSTLGAFRVDTASGKLTYLGSTPTEKQPRGFNIDPTGRFVVVSGELSDTISSYAIDAETGTLKPIGRYPTGKGANWVEIVAFD
jgi:6-phosphogluconolactonase